MKNTDPNINAATSWHSDQRAKLSAALEVVSQWPPFLRGLVGAKIVSLSNAVDSLSGKPRTTNSVVTSNHGVIAEAIDALSADLELMAVRENA
jgi:hypothetical protein